ncbi:MAG: sigma-70 family RNA polymerase sigma factor [Fuerstiella sp.]|nr:sigma-70 family RNA polymerase sigma factor [Fuerstiella sp.]MCP4853161.1 sigma-70 family RNA polymerase sigma factor [Fuerstiella sp.]
MNESDNEKRLHFETLVIEHHVRVRAFVRSLGVDPDWVDDVAQESFLTAYREWSAFDQTRDFGKWIRGIAANIVRNELRKDTRRQRIQHTELAEILLQRHAEAKERMEPLTIEAVRECMGQLGPTSLEVVHGRYRDGIAAPEIAAALGLSAANVRQMLVRIRRQIRQCVEFRVLKEA